MTSTAIAIRDSRQGNFFWAANELIKRDGPKLGVYGVSVYCTLAAYANNETATAYPSIATIAKAIACSENKVREAIKQLVSLGWIRCETRSEKGEDGKVTKHLPNLYTLLDTPKGTAQDEVQNGTSPHEVLHHMNGGTSPHEDEQDEVEQDEDSTDAVASVPGTLAEWLLLNVPDIKKAVSSGQIAKEKIPELLKLEKAGHNKRKSCRRGLADWLESKINGSSYTAAERDAMVEALASIQGLCVDILTQKRKRSIGMCAGDLCASGYVPADVPKIKQYIEEQEYSGYTEHAYVKYAPNIKANGDQAVDSQVQSALKRTREMINATAP